MKHNFEEINRHEMFIKENINTQLKMEFTELIQIKYLTMIELIFLN